MLTALRFRYPPGHEQLVIAGLRQWLGGWRGVGRIAAGKALGHSGVRAGGEPGAVDGGVGAEGRRVRMSGAEMVRFSEESRHG
jgi:hypothetical protein